MVTELVFTRIMFGLFGSVSGSEVRSLVLKGSNFKLPNSKLPAQKTEVRMETVLSLGACPWNLNFGNLEHEFKDCLAQGV